MPNNSKDIIRLMHILDAIIEIESYIKSKDYIDFQKDSMLINATIRLLEIIGETTNHLSENTKNSSNSIEWKQIIGLRNILIHEYFAVDIAIIWDVVQFDLPHYKISILQLLKNLEQKE